MPSQNKIDTSQFVEDFFTILDINSISPIISFISNFLKIKKRPSCSESWILIIFSSLPRKLYDAEQISEIIDIETTNFDIVNCLGFQVFFDTLVYSSENDTNLINILNSLTQKGWLSYFEETQEYEINEIVIKAVRLSFTIYPSYIPEVFDSVKKIYNDNEQPNQILQTSIFITNAQALLQLFPDSIVDENILSLLNNIAQAYSDTMNWNFSLYYRVKYFIVVKNLYPYPHEYYCFAFNKLGFLFISGGNLFFGLVFLKKSLELDLDLNNENSQSYSSLLNRIAASYDDDQSADLLELIIKNFVENIEGSEANIFLILKGLLISYFEDHYKANIIIQEYFRYILAVSKVKHSLVLQCIDSLMQSSDIPNDYQNLKELLEIILNLDKNYYGDMHPTVWADVNNLSLIYRVLEEFDQAEKMLKDAINFDLKYFGEKHIEFAISRSNLAFVYYEKNKFSEAKDLMKKTLESDIVNLGEMHLEVVTSRSNLALVLLELNEFDQAIELTNKAIDSLKVNLGTGHPRIASEQVNLAYIYIAKNDKIKALSLLQEAYNIYSTKLGEDYPDTIELRNLIEENQ